jgi:hypothetical protein
MILFLSIPLQHNQDFPSFSSFYFFQSSAFALDDYTKSISTYGIQHISTSYLGGDEETYVSGLGLVVHQSFKKKIYGCFSSPIIYLSHIKIIEQVKKG